MICKQCNAEIREGAKFCGTCGWKVEEEQAVAEVSLIEEELQMPEEVVEEVAETAEATEEIEQVAEEFEQAPEQTEQMPYEPVQVPEQVAQAPVMVEEAELVLETVEDIEETAPATKGGKGKKFLRGFLSTLCCFMIFVLTTAMISILIVRASLTEDNVNKMLDNTDIGALIQMKENERMLGVFTEEEVENLYYDTKIGAYIDDTIFDYAEYLRGGEVPNGISADDILNIVAEDGAEIEKAIGRYLEAYECEAIQEYIGENGKENLGFLSEDVRTNSLLKTIRACLSIYTIIGLGVLILLFVFLMLKARKYRLDTLVWTSVPVILASVTVAVFGLIKAIALAIVGKLDPVVGVGTEIVMDGIFSATLLNSAIVLGFGALLIVVYVATKSIIKAVKNKKAA